MIEPEQKARTRAVWQISGGPVSRSYVGLFLNYGIGLIGPGDAGLWTPARNDDDFEGSFVRRFAAEVSIGDIFLLRTGISKICAIGVVASEYNYMSQFDDVNGWDLQHGRRVRWVKLPAEYDFGGPVFGANPPRFSRIWSEEVIDYAERFVNSPPTQWQTAPLPALPTDEPGLSEVPSYLRGVIGEVQDLVPLFSNGQGFGESPSEDELIVHFVVPLLRSLGWPPERIGIKWRRIDVALFNGLPRTPDNCHLVIEAKRLGTGVEGALAQAKGYVEDLGRPVDIVVTDGVRYRLYSAETGFLPVAYANLARPKQSALELFSRIRRL